jgi:lysyl-tRNA synthetase class 1
MHWVDVIAEDLLKMGKEHVIASGTSISGVIHIGNAGDVIMADAVARSVIEKGGSARVLWIMDDVDPLGKVPAQVPSEYREHLGKPVSDIPSPDGSDGSYTDYFVKPFLEDLKAIGVDPEVLSGREMYRQGQYEENTRKALEKSDEVRKILAEISGSEKAEDWQPFDPVCEECGKISPTKAHAYTDGKVMYKCVEGVAKKTRIPGCEHEGASDVRNGKLTWRVEWAARWEILGVTCEPFGKEHSAAGGSYDTSKAVVEKIFDYPAPVPVLYEHIQVDGGKMSSSVGNVLTLRDMLEILPPEVVRFFYFRAKPNKHKDLKTRMKPGTRYTLEELRSYLMESLLRFMDEYEHVERLYFGVDEPSPQEDVVDLKRTYELSQVGAVPDKMFQVPYRHLMTVAQIAGSWDRARPVLGRTVDLSGMDSETRQKLEHLFERASNFITKYAPEDVRWELLETLPPEVEKKVDAVQKKILSAVLGKLKDIDWNADEIHNAIYDAKEEVGAKPKAIFGALYMVFIGKARGPRMGHFLASLEKDFVIGRISETVGG